MSSKRIKNIVLISDYLPRKCGIATFTRDLCTSMIEEMPRDSRVEVVAMDDQPQGYAYPDCVKFQVNEPILDDYARAAEFININGFDLAIVEHEYGIFGGQDGAYILRLMRELNMPIITTLHTVLREPNDGQREVMMALAELSDRLVVMSHKAFGFLEDIYGIPREKIAFIPHGIHDVPFSDPVFHKEEFNVERNKVILTFGLIGPSKGLETMIDAVPAIVEKHPDAVYLILGATHPHIVRHSGESYRQGLHQRARRLGVEQHVLFHNRFVSTDVLMQYLSTADVYVTPYPNEAQITSGTLAYALGSGKAVVSTPYWYAQELLDEGRGKLVDFDSCEALSDAVIALLDDDHERNTMRKNAYQYCRSMVWGQVASDYVSLGSDIIAEHAGSPKPHPSRDRIDVLEELPAPGLSHVRRLTDDCGVLQHAVFTTPNRHHGYCTDDNARGLVAACMEFKRSQDESLMVLIQRYLAFLHYAFDEKTKRFRNFMSYHRTWMEETGSEDSHGRALWGLGTAVKYAPSSDVRDISAKMFSEALAIAEDFESPRAVAFTVVGLHAYLEKYSGDTDARRLRNLLAERLYQQFQSNASDDWPWLEDSVTYANGILPLALMMSGQWIPKLEMHAMGIKSLRWLLNIQSSPEGNLSIVGNDGWYSRGGERAVFDQQPIEAMCLILACCEAYRSTREEQWLKEARRCLDWFLGYNDLNVSVCDFRTGGCFDGIHREGVNMNQGAESTLAWLIGLLTMHEITALQMLNKTADANEATEAAEAAKANEAADSDDNTNTDDAPDEDPPH